MQQRQRRLLQEQRAAKATSKPTPAKPSAKDGRQPRALTNTKSATMRQIRAKAVQARRQAQGKSTVASRQQGISPESSRGQRIKQMARSQRVIGDSGQVRAAQKQGQQIRKAAESKRGAKQAMQRMGTKLAQAQTLRDVVRGGKAGIMATAVKESITSRNTADGTLTAAMKRGDYKPKQGPSPKTTKSSFNKKSFNEAFREARKSGTSTFTWRGKKYTTKKKGE
jgi:hypothetical protein